MQPSTICLHYLRISTQCICVTANDMWCQTHTPYSTPWSRCGQEGSTIKTKQRSSMHGKMKFTASLNYLFSKHSPQLQIVSVTSLLCVCYDWSYYKLEHNKFCQVKQIRKTEEIFHTCAECRLGWDQSRLAAGCCCHCSLDTDCWPSSGF